ncbi:MAG: hypothetical protein HYY18_11835 [Planctomycetes bacterium]|nr:hypothetical protein [Planctomycetota bacterium]
MAYFLLPRLLEQNPVAVREKLQGSAGVPGGALYYLMTCKLEKLEPRPDTARSIVVHPVRWSSGHQALIIEYPAPPRVEWNNPKYQDFPLAPWFSAIVTNTATGRSGCWTLGISPTGGTTLRHVTAQINANCGPGSEPDLHAFVSLLENREVWCAPELQDPRGKS